MIFTIASIVGVPDYRNGNPHYVEWTIVGMIRMPGAFGVALDIAVIISMS